MGCLLALLARVALLVVWLTTSAVTRSFQGGWLLPLLGIIFLPITTLTYVAVSSIGNGVTGWAWLLVVLGFLFDVGTHSLGASTTRRRIQKHSAAQDGASV